MHVMNVASATSTASRPFALMTARSGDAAEKGAETRTLPQSTESEPLVNRFPSIAFTYDVDASRLVMQYRDPANGKTVSQIPTETALKQYKEAQQQEKDAARASTLEVTVGGSDNQAGSGAGASGRGSSASASTATAPARAQVASVGSAHVAHFSPATTHPAAASSGVARVNVVV